jgi:RNA polymerase sigma-70 factor (ECF subfamily)
LAEDLMVQTFAEAMRCIGGYRPQRATFAAWLFGIARRLVRLELRRQARRKSIPASAQVSLEGLPETSSPHDLATSITESVAAKAQLARLRASLSERELEVLVLHHVYEFSVQEIGSVIGRSGRAVESLLHRAKTKARERLTDDD